jgi:hypothetical protein
LVEKFVPETLDPTGTTVIHAGHFMLLFDGSCAVPSVVTVGDSDAFDEPMAQIKRALNKFSLETWELGVKYADALRSLGQDFKIITLVNDWQFIRDKNVGDATKVRDQYYRENKTLFPSLIEILKANELDMSCLLSFGDTYPFVSESWLRKRLKKRLSSSAPNVRMAGHHEGSHNEEQDYDFARACRSLICGQPDCAGEVMELIFTLTQNNCRRLINIIPSECEKPVNEGTRQAIRVFGLEDFLALNISVPCLARIGKLNSQDADTTRVTKVYSDKEDDKSPVSAIVETAWTSRGGNHP